MCTVQLIFLHIRRRRGALRRRQKVWQVKTLSNDRWLEAYILSSFAFHIFDPDLTIALTSDYFRVGYNTLGAKCLWSCVKICSDLFDDTTPTTDNDDGGKVVLEDWAVTVSHLMLAFIFSIKEQLCMLCTQSDAEEKYGLSLLDNGLQKWSF